MDSLIYVLFVSIFTPIFLMTLLVDKKARLPMVFVLIGIAISVFASEVNGFIAKAMQMETFLVTVTVTPVTEEILKAAPILLFALFVSDRREKLFTASMSVGIGFAMLENAYYLLTNVDTFNMLDAIIRAFGAGLMHGMCTLLVGVGISFVKKKRKMFVVGTFALCSVAITYHGTYNMLIQSDYAMVGAMLPISTYIPFLVWRIKNKRRAERSIRAIKKGEKKLRVICLDDHKIILARTTEYVRDVLPNADVVSFESADSAVAFAEEVGCDVLFTEIELYGKPTGIEVARQLQSANPRVNIIFTTVCSEQEYAGEVMELRPSAYLKKVFTRQDIQNAVDHLLHPVDLPR